MTKSIHVTIIGPEGSGKTQLTNLLLKRNYQPNSEPTKVYDEHQLEFDLEKETIQILDTTGNKDFQSLLLNLPTKENQVFLYCVDLTKPIDAEEIATNVRQYKLKNSNAKFILVGTKYDAYQGEDAQAKLKGLTIPDIDQVSITSAVYIDQEERNQASNALIQVIEEQIQQLEKEIKTSQKKGEVLSSLLADVPPAPSGTYRDSYDKLWYNERVGTYLPSQGKGTTVDRDYLSALALLKDYCKTNSTNSKLSTLFSQATLMVSHARNHTGTIRKFIKEYNGEKTVDALFTALKDKLIQAGIPLNPSGSLARRIQYIQEKSKKVSICDVETINNEINKASSPSRSLDSP